MAQYQALIKRAQAASQGPTQAGITGLQNQAWDRFGAIPGQYEGNALDAAGRAGAPITQGQIQGYENPYQQDVVNATMANLRETNAQESNQVKGNAIAQGALGGSREAVAQGELARQQGLANGQTLAGLNASNYSQALSASQADRDAAARQAGLYGGLEANAAGVAGSQLQAGTAQQGVNQAQLTQPYQQAQWLSGIEGQIGQLEGTNTSSSTSTPGPSALQTIAGLGVTAAGLMSGNPMAIMGAIGGAGQLLSGITGGAPTSYLNGVAGGAPGQYGPGFRHGGIAGYATGGSVAKPSSRAHEMMQNALEIARTMKSGIGGGDAFGGAVNPGIGVRGYDDGGGVFPSWMFDPTQSVGDTVPRVDLLERGTGRVISPASPSYSPAPLPAKNVDRVPLAPPTLAAVSPQTGIAANSEPFDLGPAGMSGSDAGIHPSGAPLGYAGMAAGTSGGPSDAPIMVDKVSAVGQGSPGGIASRFDTSGTSPQVLGGIAAQKAQAQGAPEWSLPLIAAGLGILASRSPNLGVAIGEGGLQGVNQLMSQRKQTFDQNLAQKDYDLKAKQLENQVSQFQQNYGIEKQKTDFEINKPFQTGTDLYARPVFSVADPANPGQFKPYTPNQGAPGAQGAQLDQTAGRSIYQSLPESDQSIVDKMIKGQIPMPSSAALRTPIWDARLRAAEERAQELGDPGGFDATKWQARLATRKDFSAGTTAKVLTNGNTAIGHLGDLYDTVDKLGNFEGIPFASYAINAAKNAAVKGTKSGIPISEFTSIRDKYAEEITNFYRGTGGSEADIKRALDDLDSAKSAPELKAVIGAQAELMASKVGALGDRWKNTMGESAVADFPILSDKSQKTLDKIKGVPPPSAGTQAGQSVLPIGQTATDPKTGHKLKWDGGKWVDAQ